MSGAHPEFARKLFAGPCDFFWGTGDINSLPPQSLPEIAMVGRSNAGKSSLINALTNHKGLARVSHTPGRTREINFFNLGGKLSKSISSLLKIKARSMAFCNSRILPCH